MNKGLRIFLLVVTMLFLGACDTLGTVPDVSQIQNEPFYSELQGTVALMQIPVIIVALLSLVLGWKLKRFGLAINGFVMGGLLLYTYLGTVEFIPDENFRLGFSIAGAVMSALLAYFLYNLMALLLGGAIGSMLMNGAWLEVADKVPPQILVFVTTFVSALVMFLVFRLFLVAFSAIIGAVILMLALAFDTLWVIPVAGVGIAVQMLIAFLIKDDIFQNLQGDFRAAVGQAFGDVLGPFSVLFDHQKGEKESKQAQKAMKLAPAQQSPARQPEKKAAEAKPKPAAYQAPQQAKPNPQQPYQAPQQPYQAPQQAPQPSKPTPYQAPQQPYQAPYQAPQPPKPTHVPNTPATQANPQAQASMQPNTVFRPENFQIVLSTGESFPLIGSQITVGRNPDNVIVLNDLQVSGYHLMLSIQADALVAWDNDSTNGTLLNGNVLVGAARLTTLDVLQVGSTSLRLMEIQRP